MSRRKVSIAIVGHSAPAYAMRPFDVGVSSALEAFKAKSGVQLAINEPDAQIIVAIGRSGVINPEIAATDPTNLVGYLGFIPNSLRSSRMRGFLATLRIGNSQIVHDDGDLSAGYVAETVMNFIEGVLEELAHRSGPAYLASTEVLLTHLRQLLDSHEMLTAELARLYGDHQVALARIDELEHLFQALDKERYRTKGWLSEKVIVPLALAVVGILGPVTNTIVAHELQASVKQTVEAAHQVTIDCGDNNTITVKP